MLKIMITLLLLSSMVTSLASEFSSNIILESSAAVSDKCCTEVTQSSISSATSNQVADTDCCDLVCLCACSVVNVFQKKSYILTQTHNYKYYLQWYSYPHHYKSPFIDPALKPPLFS